MFLPAPFEISLGLHCVYKTVKTSIPYRVQYFQIETIYALKRNTYVICLVVR